MITGLRAQNFKSWKDTGDIKMGALTGFFGTNSSGKTAILQILLLLKQTVESPDRSRVLNTGGDQYSYVDVGTVYDIIHNKQVPGEISFGIDWKPQAANDFSDQILLPEELVYPNYAIRFGELKFDSTIHVEEQSVTLEKFVYEVKADDNSYSFGVSRLANLEANARSDYKLIPEALNFSDPQYGFASPEPVKFYKFGDYNHSGFLVGSYNSTLQVNLEELFKRIFYLGPLRDYPHRIYTWGGQKPQDVGTKGEKAVEALLASTKEVQAAVGQNLKDLKVIHEFKLEPLAKGRREHELLIQVHEGSPFVPITDVGFGVSQVLPVLVLCHYVPEGSIIILEQPEIHLHPSVQAGLADVLIQVIKERKLQIILESHSEHLLRRLQRRIAEQTISNEDTKLYFCHIEGGESKLEELNLDEYGNINNWPENFFGPEFSDLVAMTEAQMERKIAKETQQTEEKVGHTG